MQTYKIDDSVVAEMLLNGKIGVLPTDTLYGVVALATDKNAVDRLYKLKQRQQKPGTIVAANTRQLETLGIDPEHLQKAAKYWPGPVSIILPAGPELAYLHQGLDCLALRVVANESFKRLLLQTGPLVTSSANMPGKPPATTIEQGKEYFSDRVDFYTDGGDLSARTASTIIRLTNGKPEILRGNLLLPQ